MSDNGVNKQIVLIACGCFNPPTYAHLRLLERARDYLQISCGHRVLEGVISPAADFGKPDLIKVKHRVRMSEIAVQSSSWIRVDTWECSRKHWSRTVIVLRHFKQQYHEKYSRNTQLMFVCGGDLVQSFTKLLPDGRHLWDPSDLEEIARDYGILVITRNGADPQQVVYDLDCLRQYQHNIHIIDDETCPNDISSTRLRTALRRGESIRYCTPDAVIDYINREKVYELADDSPSNRSSHQQ